MYVPEHFAADDPEALLTRLARRWAGIVVSVGGDGAPIATHAPILWDGENRVATAHIARANPHWRVGDGPGLIVLNGPEAYVTPNWYPSKVEHGKTVPTWNYEAVHLTGRLEWFEDAQSLEAVVRDLSAVHEADQPAPWKLEDAPRAYIDALLRGIVGLRLHVERIDAKRKLSQNKSGADFKGVAAGLAASDDPMAHEVAAVMRDIRAAGGDPDGN
jgi:transcriptional regulator